MARPTSDFRLAAANPEVIERVQRLREAVRKAGGNKVVVGKTGISASRLTAYLAGEEMKLSRAVELATACGVTLEWLAAGGGATVAPPPEPDETVASDNRSTTSFVGIPRLDVRASAGVGKVVVEEAMSGLLALDDTFIRQQLRRRPEDLRVIEAEGDSMDPTIRDGDLLLVDTSVQDIAGSRIYVIDINGSLLVKRIQPLLDGTFVVRSDNPKYREEVVRPSERNPMRIIGEVIYQAGPVRS